MSFRLPKVTKNIKNEQGFIIPAILSFMIALSIITAAVVMLIDSNMGLVNNNIRSQKSFEIAEAGINYYLWHLSHSPDDFKDGKATPATPDATLGYGPYVHTYTDSKGVNAGTYTLWIKPATEGSSIAQIRATGKATGSNIQRTVQATIGAPSFASYIAATDSPLWLGTTEVISGPIHSNQGIRMDGASTADVTSSNATYIPSSSAGGDGSTSHPGVWCSNTIPDCATRDKSNWGFPLPSLDFTQISGDLCTMKKVAFANDPATASLANLATACTQVPATRTSSYLPRRATAYSDSKGYLVQLNPNNTYDLFQVNSENDKAATYLAALAPVSVATGIPIPSKGVIFAEDNVWVRSNPTFHGRVTIAAARLSSTDNANVAIADDIAYSAKTGVDAIGLIGEGNVLMEPYAPPQSGNFDFVLDAAMIAHTGQILYPSRYKQDNSCTKGWVSTNQRFLYYGSVVSRNAGTWAWIWPGACGSSAYSSDYGAETSGIVHNFGDYDYNLLYSPPPSWPSTSSYNILSWREVLIAP